MSQYDRYMWLLLLVSTALGFLYISVNALFTHYQGIVYLGWHWLIGAPIFFALYRFSLFAEPYSERMACLTWTYSIYFFITIALTIVEIGIQFTPFPTIDWQLVAIDRLLQFDQMATLNWIAKHPICEHWLSILYDLLGVELALLPMCLALLLEKSSVQRYFYSIIFSFLIGTMIYYFLPTAAPSSVFQNPHFTEAQHATALKFFEIHHHLPITTDAGGMIAFPSFHVIWAILLTIAAMPKKYIFYPLAIINLGIICATVILGWHYLVDVFASLIICPIAVTCSHRLYQRAQRKIG